MKRALLIKEDGNWKRIKKADIEYLFSRYHPFKNMSLLLKARYVRIFGSSFIPPSHIIFDFEKFTEVRNHV